MRRWYGTLLLLLFFHFSHSIYAQSEKSISAKDLLRNHLPELQLSAKEIDNAFITDFYTDNASGVQYIYLQQGWQDIPVYNRITTILIKDNKVVSNLGNFIARLDNRAGNSRASMDPAEAIRKASKHLQLSAPLSLKRIVEKISQPNRYIFNDAGIAKKNMEVRLYWVVMPDTSVRLAWNVNIDVLNSPDWWNVRVDARTGEILEKDNWTVNEGKEKGPGSLFRMGISRPAPRKFAMKYADAFFPPTVTNATYNVVPFPYESPKHHPLSVESEPWLKAGIVNPANTNGWHFDGNVNYQVTRGNNVFAYLDVDDNNASNVANNWPDTSTTIIPSLSFNFPPNFSLQPGVVANKRLGVANLFYWNNLMHDVFYQYGFTEPAGNFQADNLSRGGSGSDYVLAEGQDASGANNANFSTPADGQRPRMQMYIWSAEPALNVTAPATIAGNYFAFEGIFSVNNRLVDIGTLNGQVIYYNDDALGTTHIACNAPANVLAGKIALIDRADCNFTVKVKNAQIAGAIAVIMVNNVAGDPIVMGGTDNTVTIPSLMISQSDGALIKQQLGTGVSVTMSGGIDLDGDLDNSVICHEYGHGISSRLTGGPSNSSCLANLEKGNEGWSDFISLMMITNWNTASVNDGPLPRSIGTYANNENPSGGGLRFYPYSTNIAINPLVYKTSLPAEPHDLGEHWCMALWEMTWEMIKLDGINPNIFNGSGTGGNSAAIKLVLEGMKTQPCNPGFIDARNAILKADTIFFGAHYSCAIWKAFAKRGMGRNASQGSSNNVTDQVPDFTDGKASITAQPSNASGCTGGSATFSVTVTGASLSYQWQESINGGGSFSDIAGATSASLTINNLNNGMNTYRYRCIVNGICSSNTVSNQGILSVTPGPSITTQPVPATVCAGSDASFSISVTGTVQGYQWQESTDGGNNFQNIAGATNTVLNLLAVPGSKNNNLYRCNVIASCGAGFNSTAVLLTVNSSAIIDEQPSNTAVCPGDEAVFSVSAAGNGNSYQWQVSSDNGANFLNIPGALSSSLTISNVTVAMNNYQYHCVITGNCAGTISDAAILTILGSPVIQDQPGDIIVCAESGAQFSITATGAILDYQWQESSNGGSSYSDINGATGPTLALTAVTLNQDGNRFRCIINGNCASVTSSAAIITINPLPSFTLGLLPAAVCISDSLLTVSASVEGGTWSNNIVANKFNPANASPGPNIISYSLTNDIGCTLTVSESIQVNECAERHVDLGSANALIIYPNPNSGLFSIRIRSDLFKKLGMKVYGSEGKWIKTESFSGLFYNKIIPVDLSSLSSGTYFLYFYTEDTQFLKEKTVGIVIQR